MANIASFLILVVFFWGRSLRFKNLKLHIRLMLTAMFLDMGLVFSLVIFRDVLSKVHGDMPWMLMLHVPIAVGTLVLYFFTAWAGYQLYRGNESARIPLRKLDRVLVTARVLTFATSLLVQFASG